MMEGLPFWYFLLPFSIGMVIGIVVVMIFEN